MQAAKDAVKNFTSKAGKHDTTVHETVAPAVTQETVARQQEDRVTTAVDKEVHQDHYHTSVQPVQHSEVLPEQHHHNLAAVEHRKIEHDDHNRVQQTLAAEQAKFRDQTTKVEGQHTTSAMPVVAGEHVHHHVHETVQPVIQKQTIEPHVVHTTVPIHEVHHNAAQHHATTALPAMTMSDFKTKGGALNGREERTDAFDGCPKEVHGAELHGVHAHDKAHTGLAGSHGTHNNNGINEVAGSGLTGTHGTHNNNKGINEVAGTGVAAGGAPVASSHTGHHSGHHHESTLTGRRQDDLPASMTGSSHGSDKHEKPSLLDRLNPMKDADHDGKKGFMK